MAAKQDNPLLEGLPNDATTMVLQYLDWYQKISVTQLSRRLQLLSNRGTFLSHARFSLRDHPALFTYVVHKPRAEFIHELDISNYITANSNRLETAIRKCVNLTVLRCVHTRLHPVAVVNLLRNHLRKLKRLEWSILKNQLGQKVTPEFLASRPQCKCRFTPATLRYMYLEAACSDSRTVEFACSVLEHCHALSHVHFHERSAPSIGSYVACQMLHSIGSATSGRFQSFVFTSERLPSDRTLPTAAPAFAPTGKLFADFSACADIFKNITIHMRPTNRRSCVHLAETAAVENLEGLEQLSVLVQNARDAAALMRTAYAERTYRYVEALSLIFLAGPAQGFRSCIDNLVSLGIFLRSCPLLTELSLSSFHWDPEFDYVSTLASGGLNNLRRLALVSCALSTPTSLQRLAQAPFQLRELDVRAWRGTDSVGRIICQLCRATSTCDDACLAPMRQLRHLEILTLCELVNVRRLAFLEGCDSLAHLRMRNLGLWCFDEPHDMSAMRHVWLGLLSLKLESSSRHLDLAFLLKLPSSDRLERLCISTTKADPGHQALRPDVLKRWCPKAEAIHVHLCDPETDRMETFVMGPTYHDVDPVADGDMDLVWLLSRDRAMLCYCLSYIGFTKPRCLRVS